MGCWTRTGLSCPANFHARLGFPILELCSCSYFNFVCASRHLPISRFSSYLDLYLFLPPKRADRRCVSLCGSGQPVAFPPFPLCPCKCTLTYHRIIAVSYARYSPLKLQLDAKKRKGSCSQEPWRSNAPPNRGLR